MNEFLIYPTGSGYVFEIDDTCWNGFILSALDSDELELSSPSMVSLAIRTKWLKSFSFRSSRFYFIGFRLRLAERRGSGEVWGIGRIAPSWLTPSRTKIENELVELSECLNASVREDGKLWKTMKSEGIAKRLSRVELERISHVNRQEIRNRLRGLPSDW